MRDQPSQPNAPAPGPLRALFGAATQGLRGALESRLGELLKDKELGWVLLWLPVAGAASTLWATVTTLLKQRALLLSRGELELGLNAEQLERLRGELVALWDALPAGMHWLEGAQRVDELYEAWLKDARAVEVLLSVLGELEQRADALLLGVVSSILDDEVRVDPAQALRWLERADALLKQVLEEVILPRVLALGQPSSPSRRPAARDEDDEDGDDLKRQEEE